jgi:predicted RNA binding protein YcfA (HicA-like mRNA interferase family)
MTRLPQVMAREVAKVLRALGFALVRQKGSHSFWRHPATQRSTIIPAHGGEDIDRSLLYEILREAGVTVEDFLESL